jgi:hypothetical protein
MNLIFTVVVELYYVGKFQNPFYYASKLKKKFYCGGNWLIKKYILFYFIFFSICHHICDDVYSLLPLLHLLRQPLLYPPLQLILPTLPKYDYKRQYPNTVYFLGLYMVTNTIQYGLTAVLPPCIKECLLTLLSPPCCHSLPSSRT